MAYPTDRKAVILEREVGRSLASACIHLLVLLLQGWNYLCTFFSHLNAVSRSLKNLCSVSGCLAGVFLWEREHRGGVTKSCFSMLGEFMYVPQLCHCYNVPTAVLTQQPFAELTAVPPLIRV